MHGHASKNEAADRLTLFCSYLDAPHSPLARSLSPSGGGIGAAKGSFGEIGPDRSGHGRVGALILCGSAHFSLITGGFSPGDRVGSVRLEPNSSPNSHCF